MTVSATLAELVLGVKPATLRKWHERGQVRRYDRGMYDLGDVLERIKLEPH